MDTNRSSAGQRRPSGEAADALPQGTPISRSFCESPTLDELAATQNVKPMADVRVLFGTWPGEVDDGFEEAIDELRHSKIGGSESNAAKEVHDGSSSEMGN